MSATAYLTISILERFAFSIAVFQSGYTSHELYTINTEQR